VYFYGLIVAGVLITVTVLVAMGIERVRGWWERRERARRAR